MADYIEDPKIARSIDDLKSRWPTIGIAADHPLTEFFLKRQQIKTRWAQRISENFGLSAIILLAYGTGYCLSPTFIRQHSFFLAVALIMVLRAVRRRMKPAKQFNLRNPGQLLAKAGDESQWQQIWLLPLNYRDVAGVFLGCSYHSFLENRKKKVGVEISVSAVIVISLAIYLRESFNMMAFIPCLSFLLYSIHVFSGNSSQFLHARIARAQMILSERKIEGKDGNHYNVDFFMILGYMSIINGAFIFISSRLGLALENAVDTSLIAWGCLFLLLSHVFTTTDLESKFRSLKEDEAKKWNDMIAEIIGRE